MEAGADKGRRRRGKGIGGMLALCLVLVPPVAGKQQPAPPVAGEQPPVTDYRIQPGDELTVMVFRNPSLSFPKVLVPPSGDLMFPLVGRRRVVGKTISELEDELTAAYGQGILSEPQVYIQSLTLTGLNTFVLGEVNRPGIYPLLQAKTVVGALSAAGGFTPEARQGSVFVMRKQGDLFEHSRYDFARPRTLEPASNPALRGGDIIFVPASRLAKTLKLLQAISAFIRPMADVALIERIVVAEGR